MKEQLITVKVPATNYGQVLYDMQWNMVYVDFIFLIAVNPEYYNLN